MVEIARRIAGLIFLSRDRSSCPIARAARSTVEALEDRTLLTSWYVSVSSGANTNPGTLAQPFSTIQAAANLAQPGDTVFIMGGVYHETVTPANSGTAAAPITYMQYGGQNVIVDGADPVTGWTQYNGNIYVAPQNWDLGDGNNQVMANGGQMLTEARWPNTGLDPMNVTTAAITSTNAAAATQDTQTSATINSSSLNQPAGYWVGATLHISPGQQWIWQTGTVTASSPGSVTYSYTQLTPFEVPKAGNPFYLTGKFAALDAPGEFYHDATANLLYVWMPDSSAPTNNIESKARQFAFDLSGKSYINVAQLSIRSASINTSATSTHDSLTVINATFISQQLNRTYPWADKSVPHTSGIILNGSYNTISDSYIAYSSGDGVFLAGTNNVAFNNTIIECDYSGADEAGVSVQGTGDVVSHNSVADTARSGITFYFAAQTQILNNYVYNIGLRGSDAGAIYTWGTDGKGSRLAYNEIFNSHAGGFGNSGILLDNNSSNIEVDHNLVFNIDSALKMNGTSTNITVYNNTFVGTLLLNGVVTLTNGLIAGATPVMVSCIFENNIFIGSTMFLAGATQDHNILSAAGAGFVNQGANNYQLAPGSGAIDTGVIVPSITIGYAGIAPDIGALESGVPLFNIGVPTVAINPQNLMPAQNYDNSLGINLTPPGIGSADNNDFAEYSAVYFGAPLATFTANLAVPAQYAGQKIEIHLDSPIGQLIGTLTTTSTGSFTTYANESTAISGAVGLRDVYLVFRGKFGVCNLASFQFS